MANSDAAGNRKASPEGIKGGTPGAKEPKNAFSRIRPFLALDEVKLVALVLGIIATIVTACEVLEHIFDIEHGTSFYHLFHVAESVTVVVLVTIAVVWYVAKKKGEVFFLGFGLVLFLVCAIST